MMKILTADAETARSTRRSESSEDLFVEAVQADLTNHQSGAYLFQLSKVTGTPLFHDSSHVTCVFINYNQLTL